MRWRYRSVEASNHVRRYQLTSIDQQAVYDVSEATEANSCREVMIDPTDPETLPRIDRLPNGDKVLG